MGNLGEAYCNLGMELFEVGEYEQSVENLIKAYKVGYRQEDILDHLYACFVLPNEEEFKNNYSVNCLEVSRLPYESLSLDFIPVSEEKFYIFDREQKVFSGIFELEKEPIQGEKTEFHSILYTDLWDIREIVSDLKERDWDTVYLVLNELEPKFASFLKLPRFKELYLRKAVVFKDDRLMYDFFEYYNEFYLPKSLVSADSEKYLLMIKELHDKRVHSVKNERKNVFLSICIPSYNRGSLALENVLRILQCPYDSEIEIVISNNGSTQDTEGYQKIKELNDTRVKYHEFSTNQGFATNLIKVLEMAGGNFAMIASDEDLIILEQLQEFLSCLKDNESVGLFQTSGIGPEFYSFESEIYRAGEDAISATMNLNYITGITYNMKLMYEIGAFQFINSMRGNGFLEPYVHMVFAMLAGSHADFHKVEIMLWDIREEERPDQKRKSKIASYALPENRIAQFKGALEILQEGNLVSDRDFINLYLKRFWKTYFLLQIIYQVYDELKTIYAWEDLCFWLYRENLKYVNDFPIKLTIKGKEHLLSLAKEMFWENLCEKEILSKLPEEEKKRKIILYQLIKIELEDERKEIIRNSYQTVEDLIGKEEAFLQAHREKAINQPHIIAYLYERYWKEYEKKNADTIAWDV